MYKSLHVFPYKMESRSAYSLSRELGIKMIMHDGSKSKFRGNQNKLVINWGYSATDEFPNPEVNKCTVINPPSVIRSATNKLAFFQKCSNRFDGLPLPSIPRWTTNKVEARSWIEGEKRVVFARTVLNGNSGAGIVEIEKVEDLDKVKDGTLLVEYVPKRIEYRVHVAKGRPFDIQRKGKRDEALVEGTNWRVRNLANGFVFVRNDLGDIPQSVYDESVKACNKIGLDFGAIDVIYNERRGQAYVLEANCAPGLEGTTLENYVNMVKGGFMNVVSDS